MKYNFYESLQKRMCVQKNKFDCSDIFKRQEPATFEEMEKFINLTPNVNKINYLSFKQCKDDLVQLHFLLKHLYAGYYILGEAFFCNAFERMQQRIENVEKISLKRFISIIYEGLEGLRDRHFCFGLDGKEKIRIFNNTKLSKLYYNDIFNITKIDENYFLENKKILSIEDNKSLEDFINPILNESGELFLGFILNARENKKLHVQLEGNRMIELALKEAKKAKYSKNQTQLFDEKKEDNILYVKNQTLRYDMFEDFDFSKCDWDSVQYRILDIRNNGGGSDSITKNIMKCFGFENSAWQVSAFDLCSRFDKRDCSKKEFIKAYFDNWEKSLQNNTPGVFRAFMGNDAKIIKTSDKPLIIIQNKNSTSAAESFAQDYYRHKNIVFLGENTGGCVSFGNIRKYYLNNSNLSFSFGSSIFFDNRFGFLEGVGYAPDIYYPYSSKKIISAARAFIKNNLAADK